MITYAPSFYVDVTVVAIVLLGSTALLTGCSVSTRVTSTFHSSIEERLLLRSVERAFTHGGAEKLEGKAVALQVCGLTADRDFVKERLAAKLRERACELPESRETAMFGSSFSSPL